MVKALVLKFSHYLIYTQAFDIMHGFSKYSEIMHCLSIVPGIVIPKLRSPFTIYIYIIWDSFRENDTSHINI